MPTNHRMRSQLHLVAEKDLCLNLIMSIGMPVGMTVIWFNNDDGEHSVTTLTNNTYSPPQTIDSGTISADGCSFIHQFNTPGRYVYFDQYDPSIHGVINVGAPIEIGKYFNMHVGGINSIPFNPSKLRSVVLSFVPKTVTFPPVSDITYNITLLNSTGNALYSHTYLDSDGILDLELIPVHKLPLSSSNTITKNATAARQLHNNLLLGVLISLVK